MITRTFYEEVVRAFNDATVKYLIVGGYSVNVYGFLRGTGDLDIWISNGEENLDKIKVALIVMKYNEKEVDRALDELRNNRNVNLKEEEMQKIEVISFLSSMMTFNEAYQRREKKNMFGLTVDVIGFDDLCDLKLQTGREKDMTDVNELRKIRASHPKKQQHD
jgi:predicted nucleotidyltransferase